jgi:hypothetical protein
LCHQKLGGGKESATQHVLLSAALIMPPKGGSGLAPIAVEVEGPSDFFVNRTTEPTGMTVFKRRRLDLGVQRGELGGWLSVPHWEWDSRKGGAGKRNLLRELLKAKGLEIGSYRHG